MQIASYLVTAGDNGGNDGERKDGRRSLLVYMRLEVIKALKSAIDLDRTAYSIVEEAVSDWITRKSPGKKKPVRKA
ncbi:MAG: hypothetical protein EOR67_30950 [Mesorhizobium sp.]|uniref:hypothetical protein n=1 Tax=Mesorhizobium sp. TaxID=1871066 RepID=UPI000FE8EA78|nr:hypothetical protein [Mesorhizobium sp.]RWL80665.1 MAG: hypothetical protein EOR67_30950 [Mesorhizobium sp.]